MSPLNPKMVESSWEGFSKLLLSKASDAQKHDMRMAFFSGAALMFQLQGDISEKLSEEEAMQAFTYLHQELSVFGKALDQSVMYNIRPGGSA